MASTYLSKTFSTYDSTQIFTLSAWVKKSSNTTTNQTIYGKDGAVSSRSQIILSRSDNDQFRFFDDTDDTAMDIQTNRVFRDTSSWYHIVVAVDTTQATASNRVKLYVNGTQETSFATSTYPAQNSNLKALDSAKDTFIGVSEISTGSKTGYYFDGSMAHVHFIDGTAYDADTFGETDSTTGEWKPKTSPSVTYGTNGFFLKFENASSFGEDSSGNDNDFTSNGSPTQLVDTPTNVLATFNSIHASGTATHDPNFSNTNTSVTFDNGDDSTLSTLGVNTGKWYCEFKVTNEATGFATVGAGNESSNLVTNPGSCNLGSSTGGYGYFANGQKRINGGSLTNYGNSFTTNDIIGIALDLENGAIWFSKNGTWQNSATITEIENGTTTNAAATGLSGTFFFGCSNSASGTTGDAFSVNFGNGYFGTTAVTSGNQDDAGYGTFEYEVPSGYYTLNTKNINTYG